jgi:glycosyltransferase involved in cell wall biosynthesis
MIHGRFVGQSTILNVKMIEGLDVDRMIWRLKTHYWRKAVHLVAPSRWIAEQAAKSALAHRWPITVVPNVVPVDVYRSWPKRLARELHNLPPDNPLILFGAIGGTSNPNKGWDLLASALNEVSNVLPNCAAVVFGQAAPVDAPSMPMPVYYIGKLHDDVSIATLYSAADAVVVPSRIENLPQIATEALSCGVPVVGFRTSGLPDVVQHLTTGYLARPYEASDLARGIAWLLTLGDEQRKSMSEAGRAFAMAHWAPGEVAHQYEGVYRRAMQDYQSCSR